MYDATSFLCYASFGIRATCYANYRVAVGPLVGQRWEQ